MFLHVHGDLFRSGASIYGSSGMLSLSFHRFDQERRAPSSGIYIAPNETCTPTQKEKKRARQLSPEPQGPPRPQPQHPTKHHTCSPDLHPALRRTESPSLVAPSSVRRSSPGSIPQRTNIDNPATGFRPLGARTASAPPFLWSFLWPYRQRLPWPFQNAARGGHAPLRSARFGAYPSSAALGWCDGVDRSVFLTPACALPEH